MTVACVLRSGGEYSARWVHALAEGVERWSPGMRFVCLTDVAGWTLPNPHQKIALVHDWRGWWSKLEMFRPDVLQLGPVLLLDLDTLVVGDLAPFFEYPGPLAMLNDFNLSGRAQSGVMLLRPGPETECVWRTFSAAPDEYMRRYRGDGEWLHAHTRPDRLQDMFPGKIVSFKKHCRKAPPGGDVRLVSGHGRPRFSSREAGWAHRLWTEYAGEAVGV
jgi:hypothetical protein